jgi:hypothetical protein
MYLISASNVNKRRNDNEMMKKRKQFREMRRKFYWFEYAHISWSARDQKLAISYHIAIKSASNGLLWIDNNPLLANICIFINS